MRSVFIALLLVAITIPAAGAASEDPESQLGSLLERLRAGKYEGAMEAFFAGSLALQQKPTEMKAMDSQVMAALTFYGPPVAWEIVETKNIGKDLVSLKMISKQKDEVPLFWSALFYRRHNNWEPLGVLFFDDPKKAGFY